MKEWKNQRKKERTKERKHERMKKSKKERTNERKKDTKKERNTEWMDERMNEWTNGWMDAWMNGWMNDWMTDWINESVNPWIHESMNKWINESMNQWINGSMNQWINPMARLRESSGGVHFWEWSWRKFGRGPSSCIGQTWLLSWMLHGKTPNARFDLKAHKQRLHIRLKETACMRIHMRQRTSALPSSAMVKPGVQKLETNPW